LKIDIRWISIKNSIRSNIRLYKGNWVLKVIICATNWTRK